ncbi:protein of unknown function [Methylocaldum szegediense]|uniref:Transposase n=1 Tax=Methylocaldum szegediense TaxID=73780 RepID=A0ABN8X0K2_9GAMM|nr:protein of unknown function [Methylocaldum szegediense]
MDIRILRTAEDYLVLIKYDPPSDLRAAYHNQASLQTVLAVLPVKPWRAGRYGGFFLRRLLYHIPLKQYGFSSLDWTSIQEMSQ